MVSFNDNDSMWSTRLCLHTDCCLFSRLAAVDSSSIMTLYNIDSSSGQDTAAKGMLERKDVWSVKWAEVWPHLLWCFVKHRLIFFKFL